MNHHQVFLRRTFVFHLRVTTNLSTGLHPLVGLHRLKMVSTSNHHPSLINAGIITVTGGVAIMATVDTDQMDLRKEEDSETTMTVEVIKMIGKTTILL